ncbi:MAG: hypothetical protein P8Q36_08770 [Alphaproteobacteria bacterium]|jgi:hypothetical protein|nr:hypothetical protein [Rhodospirillaceae bacterium]MDG2480944.1 hypothetical protein [Alphaproteobacteria bacterium]MBT6205800.1 hypothetical protein [Rhodospirillaceae bacterium]MBT6512660.1 hypothetical protein [Rhodospirillaceae bacterium]MBT7613905.1 hypothetical protein [Rhodospirillaceae bacterium]
MLESIRLLAGALVTPSAVVGAVVGLVLSLVFARDVGSGQLLQWTGKSETLWPWIPLTAFCWLLLGSICDRSLRLLGGKSSNLTNALNGFVLFGLATLAVLISHLVSGYHAAWSEVAVLNLGLGVLWFTSIDLVDLVLWRRREIDSRSLFRVPLLAWSLAGFVVAAAPALGMAGKHDGLGLSFALLAIWAIALPFFALMRVADYANRRDQMDVGRAQRIARRLAQERAKRVASHDMPSKEEVVRLARLTMLAAENPASDEPEQQEPEAEPVERVSERYAGREAFSTLRSKR